MAAKEKRELHKVVLTGVLAVRVGDRVVREEESTAVACYSKEQLIERWDEIEAQVKLMNLEQNRAARRANS